ncbi:hypothetical protein FRACYDRAFT_253015 [Fragilariopsis cylindrus CCMP1102]|uniref:Transmembrane protein n=1 Tax=Fragilariopsis cylindrus CCMP1102 TaxID=635003 RepID=A0A1E7ELT5_9STRA|nr:hypothetical protein FRACYDRAFT_253015 [Fragilariopsis cylindrus CCMP1102]|eukprot:OEU06806.1 hypothetical protein FRACYDRAFT_253015 [Fragilariopsis cylindrus CCMP1102]
MTMTMTMSTTTTMTMTTITLLQHLKIYSIVIGIIAIVFWIWAITNTIQNQILDGGIISFLTVIMSNIYILYLTTNNNNNNMNDRYSLQSIGTAWCVVGSYLFVTLNYFAGIIVNFGGFGGNYNLGQAIYCMIFTILWLLFSYLIWWLLKQYRLSTSTSNNSSSSSSSSDDNNNSNNIDFRMKNGPVDSDTVLMAMIVFLDEGSGIYHSKEVDTNRTTTIDVGKGGGYIGDKFFHTSTPIIEIQYREKCKCRS